MGGVVEIETEQKEVGGGGEGGQPHAVKFTCNHSGISWVSRRLSLSCGADALLVSRLICLSAISGHAEEAAAVPELPTARRKNYAYEQEVRICMMTICRMLLPGR